MCRMLGTHYITPHNHPGTRCTVLLKVTNQHLHHSTSQVLTTTHLFTNMYISIEAVITVFMKSNFPPSPSN